jgi:3'(2'), 5'-bisphosphate nucleotidase
MSPRPDTAKLPAALAPLADLVRRAGTEVMAVYAQAITVHGKADASPVTEADWRAEAVIVQGLARLSPGVPVVAEEAVAAGGSPVLDDPQGRFWLVDPLDGTREFIARNGEFTVNLALIEAGRPVLGLVLAPALGSGGRLFAGGQGLGAWCVDDAGCRRIACRPVPDEGLTVLASRSHGDAAALQGYLAGRRVARLAHAGSSLKLCLLAAGEADLYPRFGRTMEWDIAAGHAVLAAAGGRIETLQGEPLLYGKPRFENPDFVALGLPG